MMRKRKLNLDLDVPAMWDAYQRLGSVHKVGVEFGTTGDTVHHRFKRHGLKLNSASWGENEAASLKAYYLDTPPALFSITEISKRLGRSYAGIAGKASQMGLGDYKRPMSAAAKGNQSVRQKAHIAANGHPRGMLGKTHNSENRAAMGLRSKARWEHDKATLTGHMSEDNRQRRSDSMMERKRTDPTLRRGYSRGAQGRRLDLGSIFFRSSWEANYARYLNLIQREGAILRWEFEPDTFWFEEIRRGVRSYLPDFKVWPIDGSEPYYVEVKGWMDPKSATKLKRMAKYYPSIKLILVGEKAYKILASRFSHRILNWEHKRDDFIRGTAEDAQRAKQAPMAAVEGAAPDWLGG